LLYTAQHVSDLIVIRGSLENYLKCGNISDMEVFVHYIRLSVLSSYP